LIVGTNNLNCYVALVIIIIIIIIIITFFQDIEPFDIHNLQSTVKQQNSRHHNAGIFGPPVIQSLVQYRISTTQMNSFIRRIRRTNEGGVIAWVSVFGPWWLLLGCLAQVAEAEVVVSCDSSGWKTLWQDDFNGNELNPDVWKYELYDAWQYGFGKWGNKEAQFYTESNVKVEDGVLKLIAEYEPDSDRLFQLCWDECYQRCVADGKVEGTDGFRYVHT
jgi:hypothetical protein